jgi:hypothetical protein
MSQTLPSNFGHERCPLLGLHDDPKTALAYPSPWNWCYGAAAPAPLSVSWQISACLHSNHKHCQVFLSTKPVTLPKEFLGDPAYPSRKPSRGLRLIGIVVIVLLLVASFFAGFRSLYSPEVPDSPNSPFVMWSPEATTSQSLGQTPVEASPETLSHPSPGTGGICGHALDVPFGSKPQFVIHIVKSGESVNGFAEDYRTTVSAILSINYAIRTPIWENTVIVIPIGTTLTVGIPPLEVYETSETTTSLADLAQSLETDLSFFRKYNEFDDTCQTFSGWLLIPRETSSP